MGLKMAKKNTKIGNFWHLREIFKPTTTKILSNNFYLVEKVLSFNLVGHMWKSVNNWLQKCIFYGKSCRKFSKYASHLWEMLWEILWEMLWENAAGNVAGNLVGNGWGNDAVFSLNTWLRTIYCLHTYHEPACLHFFNIYLLYLIHISKGHKCSGLFCTKLQVLWFLTLVILTVKLGISLILLKSIYKAVLDSSIDIHIYPFCCISRVLWSVTSFVTGAPMPTYPVHLASKRCMYTWRGNYWFISYLCIIKTQCYTRILAYLAYFVENIGFCDSVNINKSAKLFFIWFSWISLFAAWGSVFVLLQMVLSSTNKGRVKFMGFYSILFKLSH